MLFQWLATKVGVVTCLEAECNAHVQLFGERFTVRWHQSALSRRELLERPPGAAVVLDEAVGFDWSPGTGLVFGEPALAGLLPPVQDLGDPGPGGFDRVAAHEA